MLASADPIKADMQARMERALAANAVANSNSSSYKPEPLKLRPSEGGPANPGLPIEVQTLREQRLKEYEAARKGSPANSVSTPAEYGAGQTTEMEKSGSKLTHLLRGVGEHILHIPKMIYEGFDAFPPVVNRVVIPVLLGAAVGEFAATDYVIFTAKTAVELNLQMAQLFRTYGEYGASAIVLAERLGFIIGMQQFAKRIIPDSEKKVRAIFGYGTLGALAAYDSYFFADDMLGLVTKERTTLPAHPALPLVSSSQATAFREEVKNILTLPLHNEVAMATVGAAVALSIGYAVLKNRRDRKNDEANFRQKMREWKGKMHSPLEITDQDIGSMPLKALERKGILSGYMALTPEQRSQSFTESQRAFLDEKARQHIENLSSNAPHVDYSTGKGWKSVVRENARRNYG